MQRGRLRRAEILENGERFSKSEKIYHTKFARTGYKNEPFLGETLYFTSYKSSASKRNITSGLQ